MRRVCVYQVHIYETRSWEGLGIRSGWEELRGGVGGNEYDQNTLSTYMNFSNNKLTN